MRYGVNPVQPLRVDSAIGTVRASRDTGSQVEKRFPPNYRPDDDFAGHFEFGLKYEEIHLEFFARLFAVVGPEPVEAWCRRSPFDTARVVEHTIRTQMAEEARILVIFQLAQERLKDVVEMPDQDASRIIRAVKENGWNVSGKLKKQYPQLDAERLAARIVEAVRSAFEDREGQ
ncbi:hypothetical protein ABZO33_10825 [Pseudomonas sp. CAM1A]